MKNKINATLWMMYGALCGLCWLILIGAEATGSVNIGWLEVLLGAIWIPVGILLIVACELVAIRLIANIKRRLRVREVMKHTRAQAIALGIWDKPQVLGGRALTMSAWENYGIKRKPGESDKDLRIRCGKKVAEKMAEVDEAVMMRFPGNAHGDKVDRIAMLHGIERKPGESDDDLKRRVCMHIADENLANAPRC